MASWYLGLWGLLTSGFRPQCSAEGESPKKESLYCYSLLAFSRSFFRFFYLFVSGALSMRSMNWSRLGVMIIWVRRLSWRPSGVELVATGLYSPRPPAVKREGSTSNLF